jgi:ketosteroid isomerase-like protein
VSQENLDLVRSGIEAWNQREPDLWLSYATPDIEWLPAGPAAVERAVYRGYDEVAKGITAAFETWDVFAFRESELRDFGDSVLWLGRVMMRGSASGVELDQEFAIHFLVRDGRFSRIHTFLSWQEGLGTGGLEE